MSGIDWSKAPEGAQGYMPQDNLWYAGWWKDESGSRYFWSQAEGDQGRWRKSFENPFDHPQFIARPSPSWSGEGLPPVGVACEVDYCEQWQRCEVIAHFQQRCGMVAAFTVEFGDGAKSLDAFGAESFRPIRTPEQIAADELQLATQQIMADAGITDSAFKDDPEVWVWAAALHKAGYRKHENQK